MDGSDSDVRMLGDDAFEDQPHFFLRQVLVCFVVESGDLLPIGVVTDDAVEDTNASGTGMLDRPTNLVE